MFRCFQHTLRKSRFHCYDDCQSVTPFVLNNNTKSVLKKTRTELLHTFFFFFFFTNVWSRAIWNSENNKSTSEFALNIRIWCNSHGMSHSASWSSILCKNQTFLWLFFFMALLRPHMVSPTLPVRFTKFLWGLATVCTWNGLFEVAKWKMASTIDYIEEVLKKKKKSTIPLA